MSSSNVPSATTWLWLAVVSLAISACVTEGPTMGLEYFGDGNGNANGNGSGGSSGVGSSGAGSAAPSPDGIPCEVMDLLDANCNSCHASGATSPALDSYASLTAPSASDPSRSVAELSLDTMNGNGMQMPPTGLLAAADIAPFADWVAAGMPMGDCGGGGAGGSAPNPYNTPPICTTNSFWNQGNEGTHRMRPGHACNDCHNSLNKGPIYDIAGTAYPTAHEPDDCNGTTSSLAGGSVQVIDANGQQFSAPILSGGNFTLDNTGMAFPLSVKVVYNGNEIAMVAPVQAGDGDCNTCHTQNGSDGAPGRILIP